MNVIGGIENSCNYFFSELAHRLSLDADGNYNPDKGLEVLRKYATMFGLDQPSGIEIYEANPEITNKDPERSAMGQGTHNYANVQLARYVTALANRGTVFDLSLIDKETDSQGNLVKDYTPAVHAQLDIAQSTWDAVRRGMRQVITNSSTKKIFNNLDVSIAGKTGTAQESDKRGNHAFSFPSRLMRTLRLPSPSTFRTVIPHPMPQWWQNTYTVTTTTIPHLIIS